MTQLRFHPRSISNYFDKILHGIGHRGSSFSDIDAVSHDGKTGRMLLQEFKGEHEALDPAQHWMLQDFARSRRCPQCRVVIPSHFTVWRAIRRDDGCIGLAVYGASGEMGPIDILTVDEYRARFAAWWSNAATPIMPPEPAPVAAAPIGLARHPSVARNLDADEIPW